MRFWDGGKTEDPVVGSRSRWDFSRRNMVVELGFSSKNMGKHWIGDLTNKNSANMSWIIMGM